MTRRRLRVISHEALERDYPLTDRVPNWCFRVVECGDHAWHAEGCDIRGRRVSRIGGDPEALLAACLDDARAIAAQSE